MHVRCQKFINNINSSKTDFSVSIFTEFLLNLRVLNRLLILRQNNPKNIVSPTDIIVNNDPQKINNSIFVLTKQILLKFSII